MVDEARVAGVLAIAAVGTAGLRAARNASAVIAAIRDRTGVTIEVIPGDEESRLAYHAVRAGTDLASGSLVVFDTGGGSSQFTFGSDGRSTSASASRSARSASRRRSASPARCRRRPGQGTAAIAAELDRLDGRPRPDVLVGMGGAMTNITAVKHGLATYDPDVVQRHGPRPAEIDRQIELYRSRTPRRGGRSSAYNRSGPT